MSKHTKGPWAWDEPPAKSHEGHNWIDSAPWLVDENGKDVLSGQIVCKSDYDALLIAAAPDLLEALEACMDYGSITGADWVAEKARAAITKAKGAQPDQR